MANNFFYSQPDKSFMLKMKTLLLLPTLLEN